MGDKQFSEFQNELKLELGQRTDLESIGGENYLGIWINTAYITLATKNKLWGVRKNFRFPELEAVTTDTTADGDSTVNTPTNCMIVRHVWDSTNDVKLRAVPFHKYISYTGRETAASEGKPTEYVRNGEYIYLYPRPDDEYTLYIYYRKRPAKLVDADDVTEIGAEWDEPILKLAKIIALGKLNQHDEVKREREEWDDMVRGIVGVYDQEELDREQIRKPHQSYMDRGY